MSEIRKPYVADEGHSIILAVKRLNDELTVIDSKVEKMEHRTDFWAERTLTSCGNKLEVIRKEIGKLSADAFNIGIRNHQGLQGLEHSFTIVERNYKRAIRFS